MEQLVSHSEMCTLILGLLSCGHYQALTLQFPESCVNCSDTVQDAGLA